MGGKKVSMLGVILAFLLVGCNALDHSWAWIPPDGESIRLTLNKKTRELAFGHSGLHFVVEVYIFDIPQRIETRAVFNAKEVVLTSASSRTKHISKLVSGEIIIDSRVNTVFVSLMTEDGPFPGNGEYVFER